MRSKYAAVVGAMYAHPANGIQIFRIGPERRRDPQAHELVEARTEAERPFVHIWQTAPAALRIWACGRLAASEPEVTAELLEDTPRPEPRYLDPDEASPTRYRSHDGPGRRRSGPCRCPEPLTARAERETPSRLRPRRRLALVVGGADARGIFPVDRAPP